MMSPLLKRPRDFARALALFLPTLDGYDGTCYTFLIKGCVKARRFGSWGGRADTGTAFGARRPAPRRHDGT